MLRVPSLNLSCSYSDVPIPNSKACNAMDYQQEVKIINSNGCKQIDEIGIEIAVTNM